MQSLESVPSTSMVRGSSGVHLPRNRGHEVVHVFGARAACTRVKPVTDVERISLCTARQRWSKTADTGVNLMLLHKTQSFGSDLSHASLMRRWHSYNWMLLHENHFLRECARHMRQSRYITSCQSSAWKAMAHCRLRKQTLGAMSSLPDKVAVGTRRDTSWTSTAFTESSRNAIFDAFFHVSTTARS